MKWTIEVRETRSGLTVVEADTADEATEKFWEDYQDEVEWDKGHSEYERGCCGGWEITSVTEREE